MNYMRKQAEHNQDDVCHIDGYGFEHAPGYDKRGNREKRADSAYMDQADIDKYKNYAVTNALNLRDEWRVNVARKYRGAEAATLLASKIKMERNGQMELPLEDRRPYIVSATEIGIIYDGDCNHIPHRGFISMSEALDEDGVCGREKMEKMVKAATITHEYESYILERLR